MFLIQCNLDLIFHGLFYTHYIVLASHTFLIQYNATRNHSQTLSTYQYRIEKEKKKKKMRRRFSFGNKHRKTAQFGLRATCFGVYN